jgi:asparagine synthase (glutamine-hydrolysing)
MGTSLAHRGPDGKATWISNDGYAGFSHRRLTIIDTSEAAAQPMHYAGSYTIIHNGEIYNYIELREELKKKGYEFKTVSDTEVILAAYAHYREKCVEYFDGMFSFAIWDDHKKILFCARDRFGEKPFYYTEDNGFYFASEIKAFSVAGILSEHDNGMLLYFLGSGNTIDPSDSSRTFYRRIKKLPASHWLKYDVRNSAVTINKYWEVSREVSSIKVNEAQERLNELLSLSVNRRLRSDVPIGTSLSGGLDSSSIAACLSEMQVSNLKTFTASFPGFEKDEAGKAKKVADKFNLRNMVVTPTAADLANGSG